jgi:hypothetical protein
VDNIVEVILRVRDQASAALAQVQRAAGDVRRSLGEVQRGLEGLGSSLGVILGTGGLAYALSSAARAAQEADASMRVLANTARAAGVDYAQLSAALNQVLQPLGVLPSQAASAAAQLLRAGFTTEQIMAAFQAGAASALNAGKTAAEGINNVAMALSTGQSIYLNYIGIAENIGLTLNKIASSMKGASDEAIRQAQNQAALNIILRATAQEVASLPDLLTGLTGAANRFNLELYQLKVTIGQQVRPALTALYQIGADLLGLFRNLDPAVRQSITTWTMATTAATGLATAAGMLLPVIRNAATVLLGLGRTLLWLVSSPIGLVVAGVALLAREWIRMSGDAEEARRKLYILGQALWGLAEVARGVVQAMGGLLSNLGNGLAAIARAFLKVVQGDFAGAWEEIKKSWNLEGWAQRFIAANESFKRGLDLIGSSFRGEVRPEVEKTGKALEDLVARWQSFFNAAQKQGGGAPKLPPIPGLETGAGAGTGGDSKTQTVADKLRDSLTALKQLYELGRISAEQYAQGLKLIYDRAVELEKRFPQLASALRDVALDAKKGLEDLRQAAEENGKAIADAVFKAVQAITDAKEQARLRAWEINFPPPDKLRERIAELQRLYELGRIPAEQFIQGLQEVYDKASQLEAMFPSLAPGYQDVLLIAQRGIEEVRRAIEEDGKAAADALFRWVQDVTNAKEQARLNAWEIKFPPPDKLRDQLTELRRQLDLGRISINEYIDAVQAIKEKALELEPMFPAMAAGYRDIAIQADNAAQAAARLAAELAATEPDSRRAVFGAFNPPPDKLREELSALQRLFTLGRVSVEDYANALQDIYDRASILEQKFPQLAAGYQDVQVAVQSAMRSIRQEVQDLPDWEYVASGLKTLLEGAPDVARGTVETVRSLIGQLGADDLKEVYEKNIAFLVDLQQRVPEGTDAYRALAAAIAELRLDYINLFPVVRETNEEIFTPAEDYYDVVAGATAYREELEKLLDEYERGNISQEEFNQKLAELLENLQGILPAWEEWVAAMEAAGVNMDDARQALATLNAALAQHEQRVRSIEQTRLDRWVADLTNAIQTATDAVSGMLDAFSADSFGKGLAQFARGLGGLIGLFPGGGIIGGLVSAVGGAIGRLWDTLASAFANSFESFTSRVERALQPIAERFRLITIDAFRSAARDPRTARSLAELIDIAKNPLNKLTVETLTAIASALEGGVLNGVKRAATAFLRGAADWAEQLRQGIQEAIESAVIEAVIQGSIIKGALGKLLDQLVAALGTGDYSLAQNIIRQIAAAIPGLVSALEGVLTPFRNALESAFPSDSLTGPGVKAIQYQLPTVSMGAPAWVSEMGKHVERFGLYIEDLVERGIRVQVVGADWVLREVAV